MSNTPRTDKAVSLMCHVAGVDVEFARTLERDLAFLKRCCRVVYYPPDGSYPIEHAPGAGKDQFDEILRRQEPAMNGHGIV